MPRTHRFSWALSGPLVLSILLLARPAFAADRAFVSGLGGLTFQTVTNSAVAGNAGITVSKHVQVFGEVGRAMNILPKADQQTIDQNAETVGTSVGQFITTSGRLSAIQGVGGVRLSGDTVNRVTPFAEAAFGVARLSNHITAVTGDGTDFTPQILPTAFLAENLTERDRLLILGGGLDVAASHHAALDLGYRYSRYMAPDTTPTINTGNVYGAVKVRF